MEVPLGGDALLACQTEHSVVWLFNEKELKWNFEIWKVRDISYLKLLSVSYEHYGRYLCVENDRSLGAKMLNKVIVRVYGKYM